MKKIIIPLLLAGVFLFFLPKEVSAAVCICGDNDEVCIDVQDQELGDCSKYCQFYGLSINMDSSGRDSVDCADYGEAGSIKDKPVLPENSASGGGCLCSVNISGPMCEINNMSLVVPLGNFNLGNIFDYVSTNPLLIDQIEDGCSLAVVLADSVFDQQMRGVRFETANDTCELNQFNGSFSGHDYNLACQLTDNAPVFEATEPSQDGSGAGSGSSGGSGSASSSVSSSNSTKKTSYVELINPIGGTIVNPQGTFRIMDVGANFLRGFMGILGSGALLVFVYGGVMWLTSMGNEDKVKKGLDAMKWAVIGIFIIFSSYAILGLIIDALRG